MSKEPDTHSIDVQYTDAEPNYLTVPVVYDTGTGSFREEYKFKMDGSTAVFWSIQPDGNSYPWQGGKDRREAAAEAVEALPFVQAVAMPGVDG
jgi:hypothetical protein